jgi:hypothetical protein
MYPNFFGQMNKISAEITDDDIKFIAQVTKSFLEKGIPYDIITRIVELCYKKRENEYRYWDFSQECGSGGDLILMKMSKLGDVEIICQHLWMAVNNRFMVCSGKYKPVYGSNGVSYGLIIIDTILKREIINFKAEKSETILSPSQKDHPNEIYFDFIQFDKYLKTEWGENVPINLYIAGGGQSTEQFNAYIALNTNINFVKDAETKEISMLSRSLKLEEIDKDTYERTINIFKQSYSF